MLTILTGPDRMELTNAVLRQLREAALAERPGQILIVPEQFSHEAERKLCTFCGDTVSRFAEVLSFSRLSDRLAACYGGAAKAYLDKGGQLLTMALAAEQVSPRIKLFAPVLRKPEFLSDLVRMVAEFQSYCLLPAQLKNAAEQETGLFAQKLEELSTLYEAYLAVCANGKADPADKLLRLIDELAEGSWAKEKVFYLDGFSDFTGAELAVLESLILHGKHVVLALCTGAPGTAMEQQRLDTLRLLHRTAAKWEIPCRTEKVMSYAQRPQNLQEFLIGLFSSRDSGASRAASVRLWVYASVEEECRGAVQHVRILLSQGARCRDISIACTNMALYEAPLTAAFRAADLPVYVAGEVDILTKPLIAALCGSLFAAAGPMDYEEAAVYLKSELPLLERDRCDRLDNYAYLWNIRGVQWEKPWELHPRGFGEVWTEEDRARLEQLNRDKTIALMPLLKLRKALLGAKNTGDMVLAVYDFLECLQLREKLEEQANRHAAAGRGQLAQELVQLYEILCQSLEQLWLTLRDTVRTPEDFCGLYQMLLTQYRVGTIPAGLDQLHISSLPDQRYGAAKHFLVLGANDGAMPAYQTAEGLLTEDERRRLLQHGLQIAPGRAEQLSQELGQIYAAFFSAERSLAISCAGEQPAWLFQRAAALCPDSLCQTPDEVFLRAEELAAWRLRTGCGEEESRELRELEKTLEGKSSYQLAAISEEAVYGLYGSPIQLSASKIDTFAACKLEYFLRYGLKAEPRKQAKLDKPAFGTLVHAVLEHTVKRVMEQGGFETVPVNTVLQIAAEEMKAYAEAYLPPQAEREDYLFRRSEHEVMQIVRDLWEELRASKFRPAFCEIKFAKDGALPTITIQGKKTDCQVMGLVDRVDLYADGGQTYVRVVDYKTGTKDFDYTDIQNGAGLQMLIYLFAFCAFGKDYLGTGPLEAAGVLYVPAKQSYPLLKSLPDDADVDKEQREKHRRKGLIRRDESLLSAMEEDPEHPRYMPYSARNGDYLADQRQMELLERHVIRTVADMADQMACGQIEPNPMVRGQYSPCQYCDYTAVCHKDLDIRQPRELAGTSAALFWEKLEKEDREHG